MPKQQLEEWEKSHRLNTELRADIKNAAITFCFRPLFEIFVESAEVLAWDIYYNTVDQELLALYNEKTELITKIIIVTDRINLSLNSIPKISNEPFGIYNTVELFLPLAMPIFNKLEFREQRHNINNIENPKNKKERALCERFKQLNTDIKIFTKQVNTFNKDLTEALNTATTTKNFIEKNPDFEGYMKQSLKKFYNDKYPNVIESLNSAMNVRKYASLTTGYRLQAYQKAMLSQLV